MSAGQALADAGVVVGPSVRHHADRAVYRQWVWRHYTGTVRRHSRLGVYDEFVAQWPHLEDWFNAPLAQRLLDCSAEKGRTANAGPQVRMPYLVYLSLVEGVALDYDLLLGRTFASPFTTATYPSGLGVDLRLFDQHVARLTQLGYTARNSRHQLAYPLGRMLLHRGDPDLNKLGTTDLDDLRAAILAFAQRLRVEPLRAFHTRTAGKPQVESAETYFRTALSRLYSAQVLLFHVGQSDRPPSKRIDAGTWVQSLDVPMGPPRIAAVIQRYLRLHLDANLDRPQTVRHSRDALRRLVEWLDDAHPEITTLADLRREHAEEFLRWLGGQTNRSTGAPLAATTRRSVITLLNRFVSETAAAQWPDVPARVLFTRADIPKIARTLPRFIPDHELAALMTAVDNMDDPYQRAALMVARWSGARRDEIRRLAVDCLDTYPDGHPRLRIPVGKGHAERSIPLHPQAAEALQPLIDTVKEQQTRPRFDASAGRSVQHLFTVRGRLLSNAYLFDLGLKAACTAAGLVDSQGRATISAHRFRHTVGTQLAEGGARLQTIMAILGHRTPAMSLIYASLSDPTVKAQYQAAISGPETSEGLLAGPAAAALRDYRLDPEAVSWLQTNFLKTELELGHCLRLPQEGPCECDLVLTCSKFLTTSAYAPRLRQRLATETQLIEDARHRGWQREVERHQATYRRIEQLLTDLGEPTASARPCKAQAPESAAD